MLFNSIGFAFFLPIVLYIYWFVTKNKKHQNILLFISSYYFYSFWDWRFLFLLFFSTFLDYFSGIKIYKAQSQQVKRFYFWLSIIINLGLLGVFKYYNFFVESFSKIISNFGFTSFEPWILKVILPVGISFYTFHGISYIIDIYKGRIKVERNFIDYAVFVSFFPLLVAGPIERAMHLLPQLKKERNFDYLHAIDGLKQILWGLFKKIVIADNCAEYANIIFNNQHEYTGSTLALGALFFTFQIYGDFSGYSDIALGTARLFGIELLRNFSFPYFSRDLAEFWRRWHISLSSWFRDYVYIPLGGSKVSNVNRIRNVFIIFILSGLWHGANWTFIAWGILNAIFMLPSVLMKTNRKNIETIAKGKLLPTVKEFFQMSLTFILIVFLWIFFRSENITFAFEFVSQILSKSFFTYPQIFPKKIIALIIIFLLVEWFGREDKFAIATLGLKWNIISRSCLYLFIILTIFYLGNFNDNVFIYFQF
jgi:alginate O-acetyltransferase complex protein AlgI